MSECFEGTGKCLCSSVSITVKSLSNSIGVCHCNMCRRWGGGPFMEINCGDNVSFSGEENISIFNSSDWAERGFCKKCGTHLFYKLKEGNQHMVPVGLFDIGEGMVFDQQVFIDEKPSYYCFLNQTENMTGAELFAKFAPTQE
jgi:hypothetical protein